MEDLYRTGESDWMDQEARDEDEDEDEMNESRTRRLRREGKQRRNEERGLYSQKYADRAKELDGLRGQDLLDALKPGDILVGSWGYNRTITDWFIVKRKTAKRIYVHAIERTKSDSPENSYGGWETCPILPPRENARKQDIMCSILKDSEYIKNPDYPKFLKVWDGRYGWENMD